MNKKISPKAFFEEFSGQDASPSKSSSWINKNTARAMALTAVMVLSGCATTGTAFEEVQANNNILQAQGQQTVQLKEINHQNFKEVMDNHQSGVYADPFETDNIVTFEFYQDANAEETIRGDLEKHGLDPDAFNYNRDMGVRADEWDGRNPTGSNLRYGNFSRHVQDPLGYHSDINLNRIDHDKEKGFGMSREALIDNPQFADYSSYFVMMHEVAHGFDYQQLSFMDYGKLMFDNEFLIQMENGSDFAATIMTLQLMDKKGESLDTMNEFLDEMIEARRSGELGHLKSEGGDKDGKNHATSVILKTAKQMLNEDPDTFLKMEKPDIIKASEIASRNIVEHDFTEEVVAGLIKDQVHVIDKSSQTMLNFQRTYHQNPEEFDEKMDKLKAHFKGEGVAGKLVEWIENNEDKFATLDNDGAKDAIVEILAAEVRGENGLTILKRETQSKMAEYNVDEFPTFAAKISGEMKIEGFVETNLYVENLQAFYEDDSEMGFNN